MTKEEMVALLRDAQEFLGHGLPCTTVCGECIVAARIDAALAEHDTVPPGEVEWDRGPHGWVHDDGVNELRVYRLGGEWRWVTDVAYRVDGTAQMLDEAKSAAIAAARGMK